MIQRIGAIGAAMLLAVVAWSGSASADTVWQGGVRTGDGIIDVVERAVEQARSAASSLERQATKANGGGESSTGSASTEGEGQSGPTAQGASACSGWTPRSQATWKFSAPSSKKIWPGGNAVVQLEVGNRHSDGAQVAWAHVHTNGDDNFVSALWMDVSFDGGNTWIQCGPFHSDGQHDTYVHRTSDNPNWKMRACARVGDYDSACGNWW